MKKLIPVALAMIWTLSAFFAVPSGTGSTSVRQVQAQGIPSEDAGFVLFQATGPTAASIQETVNAYRLALGEPNNGNAPGQFSGRREINWDGGSTTNLNTAVTLGSTLATFQNTRGALFT